MNPIVKNIGPFSITISQADALFSCKVALNVKVGGGSAAGVAKVVGSLEADLTEEEVLALGFADLNKVLPASIEPLAELGEAAIESEVKSL